MVVVTLTAYVLHGRARPAATVAPPAAPAPSEEPLLEEWCADGLEPIAGGGCFAAPHDRASEVPLVVYLHGRYSTDTTNEELDRQARVARHATARGFAVVALRGQQGECVAPFSDYWCWPSNERNQADGPAFVARWSTALTAARKRIGPGPNVLFGFSNGAYFAVLIATRALAPFEAVVVAHGGPVEPTHAEGVPMPMLLITADDDASDPEMQLLDDELSRAAWPHALVARDGGHALPDWDIEAALTFFTRARSEKLPFVPPLATRSRRPRVAMVETIVDASTDDDR
jgi:poly(3-hydroxybutyrate) depolymerase